MLAFALFCFVVIKPSQSHYPMFVVKQSALYCCQPKVSEVGHNYSDDDHDHDTVWDMLADSVALEQRWIQEFCCGMVLTLDHPKY